MSIRNNLFIESRLLTSRCITESRLASAAAAAASFPFDSGTFGTRSTFPAPLIARAAIGVCAAVAVAVDPVCTTCTGKLALDEMKGQAFITDPPLAGVETGEPVPFVWIPSWGVLRPPPVGVPRPVGVCGVGGRSLVVSGRDKFKLKSRLMRASSSEPARLMEERGVPDFLLKTGARAISRA